MDFSFTSDQQDLRELAAKILDRRHHRSNARSRCVADDDGFDRDLWSALAEAGIVGISLPESAGGAGLGFLETCIVLEEVGRTAAPVPALAVDGACRSCAGRVRCDRRARRRRRRHPHRHRRAHRGGGRSRTTPATSTSGGKLTGEKVCVPCRPARRARSWSRRATGSTLSTRRRPASPSNAKTRCSARRWRDWCCATRRRPSSPVPRVSRGCSSVRGPPWPSRCRARRRPRSTSRRRT